MPAIDTIRKRTRRENRIMAITLHYPPTNIPPDQWDDLFILRDGLLRAGYDMSPVELRLAYADMCEHRYAAGWLRMDVWNSPDVAAAKLIDFVKEEWDVRNFASN